MLGFETAAKVHRAGTDRTLPLSQTIARAEGIRRAVGITRVANVTGLDHIGIPVVAVFRPNSRSVSVFQGKGLTLDAARASGLMEAIEAFHAERVEAPLLLASCRDLRTRHPVVDVEGLPRLLTSQYHENLELLWIEASDLRTGEPTWVPYELVHMNYRLPLPAGSGAFYISSNGLASGNHPLEAISHGICELVERDALTLRGLLSDDAKTATRLDLSTVDDPESLQLLALFERADVSVFVWDATSDIALPTFLCQIFDRAGSHRGLQAIQGSGCHPRRSIALNRALTEAAQTRLTAISGSRDDVLYRTYAQARERREIVVERLAASRGARSFRDVPSFESDDVGAYVERELELLRRVDLDRVLFVDLTKRGIDLPVVRVVIPGLEGMAEFSGYVPGRRARRLVGRES